MSKRHKKLTKGQKWFRSLTPEQQAAYMSKKTAEKDAQKSIFRRNRSIALMKPHAGQYNCKDCIHGKSGSCTDNLENGCEYFEDLITGRSARFLIGT